MTSGLLRITNQQVLPLTLEKRGEWVLDVDEVLSFLRCLCSGTSTAISGVEPIHVQTVKRRHVFRPGIQCACAAAQVERAAEAEEVGAAGGKAAEEDVRGPHASLAVRLQVGLSVGCGKSRV